MGKAKIIDLSKDLVYRIHKLKVVSTFFLERDNLDKDDGERARFVEKWAKVAKE